MRRRKREYFIEVTLEPYPNFSYETRVHRNEVDLDELSPGLVVLKKVWAYNQEDAISKCILGEGEILIGGQA